MTRERRDATLAFESTSDPPGLRIVDPIEGVDFTVETDRPVFPAPASTDPFYFPVDRAATVDVGRIEVPYFVGLSVRTADGSNVVDMYERSTERLPRGRYTVELAKTPVKLYVDVAGAFTAQVGEDCAHLEFGEDATVTVGARSYHERPSGRITTTRAPESVATTISHFGSALKTYSPERSWPTLRGYPPLVTVGEKQAVPDGIDPPDTDVSIVAPPRTDALSTIAPLAYYLGATVRLGSDPRLCADGDERSLTRGQSLARTATSVLQRQFTLDCLVRTVGYYNFDIHEQASTEEPLPFDLETVYEMPLPERVATYMDVPRDAFADAIPRWKVTADIAPDTEALETLPHLANELAAIRRPDPEELADPAPGTGDGPASPPEWQAATGESARLTRAARDEWDPSFVYPRETESVEHVYLGDGVPVGASPLTPDAYEHQFQREGTAEYTTTVTVVTNDERMAEGDEVAEIYALGELDTFDVTVLDGVTRERLREALAAATDLFHFVGHVDERGFQCTDGFLDAAAVDAVGVETFILNACASFTQGETLVERGAIGGIVTLQEVFDPMADHVGKTIARLLGHGFSLATALDICTENTEFPTDEYLVVGDGSVRLTTTESGVPFIYRASWSDGLTVTPIAYPTADTQLGTTLTLIPGDEEVTVLGAGEGAPLEPSLDAFVAGIHSEPIPILIDGSLYWSPELSTDTFARLVGAADELE